MYVWIYIYIFSFPPLFSSSGENLSEFTHRLFVQEVLATISSSSSFPDPARFTILSAMSGKKPDFVSSYWAHIYSHCQDMLSQRALRLQTHEVGIPSVEFARRRIAYRRSPPEGMDLGSIGALFKIACEISTLFRLNTLPSWNPDASQHLDSISGDSGSLSPTSKSETASLNDSSRSSESAESSQSEHANVAMETKTSPHTRVLHGSDANIDDMKKSQGLLSIIDCHSLVCFILVASILVCVCDSISSPVSLTPPLFL